MTNQRPMPVSRRVEVSVLIGGEPRLVNVLLFRGAVFFDLQEWRCILCECSGAAARYFTHDEGEEQLWRELELPRTAPPLSPVRKRGGRYVDRRFLSQFVFALEPTREGCAIIYTLSQIEIQCCQSPLAQGLYYLGDASDAE